MSSWREATRVDEIDDLRRGSVWLGRPPRACVRRTCAMPRSDRSPGEYSSHRGTPKKGPPSDRSSDYDSEDDDGPTLFGSILRTLMAGGAVVAIAVLVRVASAFHGRPRVSPSKASRTTRVANAEPGRASPDAPRRPIGPRNLPLPARLRETSPPRAPLPTPRARADRLFRLPRVRACVDNDRRRRSSATRGTAWRLPRTRGGRTRVTPRASPR